MDLAKRRQHVDRITASLGEQGSHIPSVNGLAEPTSPSSSFVYTPELTEPALESEELNIPHGTPTLFEAAPEVFESDEGNDERVEQPSPLHPQELPGHATNPSSESQTGSLEDKFAQAINNLEAPQAPATVELPVKPESLASEVATEALEQADTSKVDHVQEAQDAAQAGSAPHADHFQSEVPETIIVEDQGVEDAGLGLELMKERQKLMMEQRID